MSEHSSIQVGVNARTAGFSGAGSPVFVVLNHGRARIKRSSLCWVQPKKMEAPTLKASWMTFLGFVKASLLVPSGGEIFAYLSLFVTIGKQVPSRITGFMRPSGSHTGTYPAVYAAAS